jgi:hypothetical protein
MQGVVRLGATTLLALALAASCSAAPIPHVVAEPAVARMAVICRRGRCNSLGLVWIVITVILLILVLSMLACILLRRHREPAAIVTPSYSTDPAVLAGVAGAGAPLGAYPPKQDGKKTLKSEALHEVHPAPYPQTTTTDPGLNMVYQTPVNVPPSPVSMIPPVGGYGAPDPTHHSGQQQTPRPPPPLLPPASVPPNMYGSVILASANDLNQAPSHIPGIQDATTSWPVHAYGSGLDQTHVPAPNPR